MSHTKRSPSSHETGWKATRDKKGWMKAPASFKKITAAKRKAKEKQALRAMGDPDALIVPVFPKSDTWDYN